jgi:dimethyl sulfoxide reductase membrane subunit
MAATGGAGSGAAAATRRSPARTIWLILIGLGFAAGIGAWIYQLINGLAVTNMRNPTMWGLYITLFMYFVGLSAGGLIVASAGRLFGGQRLMPIVRVAVLEATVAVMLAALFLVPDMGRPDRIWHLFRYPHFTSPLIWDITIVTIYFIISLVYVWVYTRRDNAGHGSWMAFGTGTTEADARRDDRMKWVLAAVGLPAAILLHSITAWIFGLQIARGFWYTALMAPLFIASALVSGTGLMILLTMIVRRVGRISFPDDLVAYMAKLLAIFVAVEAFFVFCEMLTAAYAGAAFEADPVWRLLTGRFSPLFWFEIVIGLLVPFVLLVVPRWRLRAGLVAVASALAVIGIFAHRLNIVLNGLTYATIPYAPGVAIGTPQPAGTDSFAVSLAYYPSWVEWVVALGVLCFGALVFTAGVIWLPLRDRKHGGNHGSDSDLPAPDA